MSKKKTNQRGKYQEWITEEGLLKLEGWARDGLTDKQIAEEKIGISERTLTRWKERYPSVMSALKKGKEVVDRQVENALLKSALGFHYKEEMVTNQGEVVEVVKYEKPSTTAQIFWLKNRKPEMWRDKQEHRVENITPVFLEDVPEDDD
jgi:hypothetical protein